MGAFAQEIIWGNVSKIDLDKTSIENIFKNYVDTNSPESVRLYKESLQKQKKEALENVASITFVDDGLMWQDTIDVQEKVFNRLELKMYCKELTLAQREDWRVPTYQELLSLVDYKRSNPASKAKIMYIAATKYWSSTQSIGKKGQYWFVDFKYGKSDTASDLERYNARCVRKISEVEGEY